MTSGGSRRADAHNPNLSARKPKRRQRRIGLDLRKHLKLEQRDHYERTDDAAVDRNRQRQRRRLLRRRGSARLDKTFFEHGSLLLGMTAGPGWRPVLLDTASPVKFR